MIKDILKRSISLRGLFALSLLLLLSTNLGLAQKQQNNSTSNMTPYERRIDQIQKQAMQRYGMDALSVIMLDEGLLRLSVAGYKMKSRHTQQEVRSNQIVTWYLTQVQAAKKLWSKADVEKQKRKDAERARRQEIEHLKESNYGALVRDISNDFNEWQAKGEFEKRVDYDQRLKDSSVVVLDRISMDNILGREKYWRENINHELHIQRFDVDREVYPIYINRYQQGYYDFSGDFPCPTEIAKGISGDTYEIKISDLHLAMCNDGLIIGSIKADVLDPNRNIIYSKNVVNNNKERKVLPLEIKRAFLEIGENPYLKDYVFTYK